MSKIIDFKSPEEKRDCREEDICQFFEELLELLRDEGALIHCITSPVAINDCANAVLAIGSNPIMAEHPSEVERVTSMAGALSLSTANITDARAESIQVSAKKAAECDIPVVLDLVGISISSLRLFVAKKVLSCGIKKLVIKGNASEIRYLAGRSSSAVGVDAGKDDVVDAKSRESVEEMVEIIQELAGRYDAAVMVTGEVDLIADGEDVYRINNGCELMGWVTGMGCTLTCFTAAVLSEVNRLMDGGPMEDKFYMGLGAAAAVTYFGICGELAAVAPDGTAAVKRIVESDAVRMGLGTYRMHMMDALSLLTAKDVAERTRIECL